MHKQALDKLDLTSLITLASNTRCNLDELEAEILIRLSSRQKHKLQPPRVRAESSNE